jgi:hypothetical protein
VSDLFKDLKDLKVTGDLRAEEKKVERALFFVKGKMAFLLHEVGPTIEADLEGCCGRDSEAGPHSELPDPEGLWIWEGTPGWSSGVNWEGIDEGGDPIYEGRGKARRPNVEEMAIILGGPIEKLWGPSQLRNSSPGHCSQHMSGDDPDCYVCYPRVNPPKTTCSTCGLPTDDPNPDGSPPGCPGPNLWESCAGIGEDGTCGIHQPGTTGCVSTRKS